MNIIAENTSSNYSMIAINGIKERLIGEFEFLKNICIKERSVIVDENINSVGKNQLKRFFTKAVNMIGPNYLRVLLSQRLNQKELLYLENLGLRFG